MANEVPVVETVYAIRPYLRDLIGDAAPQVEADLLALAERAAQGEQVDVPIIDVLGRHRPTRDWARRYLGADEEGTKSLYQPAPGMPAPGMATAVYVCAQCGWRWVRRAAGQPVPLCPYDGSTLAPVLSPASSASTSLSNPGEDSPGEADDASASANAG